MDPPPEPERYRLGEIGEVHGNSIHGQLGFDASSFPGKGPGGPESGRETAPRGTKKSTAPGVFARFKQKTRETAFESKPIAVGYFMVLHFPSLAITFTFLGMYLVGYQWNADDNSLRGLLVASKIHEMLIVVSLSNVLFHRIRYNLLDEKRGLTLGLLTSPFQLSEPLYLISRPFLASLKTMFKSPTELVTTTCVLVCFLLAMVAAPSSGIVMLPRRDWWPLPASHPEFAGMQKKHGKWIQYIRWPLEDLFPSRIDNDSQLWRSIPGLPSLIKGVANGVFANIDWLVEVGLGRDRYLANITVVDPSVNIPFLLMMHEEVDGTNEGKEVNGTKETFLKAEVTCTSPMAVIAAELFTTSRRWLGSSAYPVLIKTVGRDLRDGCEFEWKQPRTSMQCVREQTQETRSHWQFGDGIFGPVMVWQDDLIPTEAASKSGFVRIRDGVPIRRGLSNALRIYDLLCLIEVAWIEGRSWISTPDSTILQESVSRSFWDRTAVNVDIPSEWANSIMVPPRETKPTASTSGYTGIVPYIEAQCSQRGGNTTGIHTGPETRRDRCAVMASALFLTGLVQKIPASSERLTASSGGGVALPPGKAAQATVIETRFYHQTHSYRFEGVILFLAFSVLVLHVLVVWAHFSMLVLGNGWYSRAWSDLSDLLVLAVVTKPAPLLKGASSPERRWSVWRHRVFVKTGGLEGSDDAGSRTTLGNSSAEMVFWNGDKIEWSPPKERNGGVADEAKETHMEHNSADNLKNREKVRRISTEKGSMSSGETLV